MIAPRHRFPFSLLYEDGMLKRANIVSLSRAALIVPILVLLILDMPNLALALYVAAALTDGVDGWLARRDGQASAYGAGLDAAVDNVFSLGIAAFLFIAYPDVVTRHGVAMLVLFGGPLAYLVFSYVYCRRLMMFHFWSAKAGALLLFALWPVLAWTGVEQMLALSALVVGVSRIEQVAFLFRGGSDLNATHGLAAIPRPSREQAKGPAMSTRS